MANIAFFQNRLGRTDGVSLEVDKWRYILENKMGHKVWYCSGNDDVPGNYVIPELYAAHPLTAKILKNASVKLEDYTSEEALELDIYNHADQIEEKLIAFIKEEKIDILIPNNLCSGGFQPAAAIAFHNVIRKTGLPTIIHSHDFYFESEQSKEVYPTCHTAWSIYDRYFPTKLPNVQHVVINRLSKNQIKKTKNIESIVVPNVFDFDQPQWIQDDYNKDFRKSLGIKGNDIVFLQATRILDRKGIELAIDVVSKVANGELRSKLGGANTSACGKVDESSRVILLCAGIVETIGISGDYWTHLQKKASDKKVELMYCGDSVKHSRGTDENNNKIYSLWDTYVNCDFVTYPSIWEGWGNQLIEAIFAKLPVLIFEYPVWTSDLALAGFDVVSLGDTIIGQDAYGLALVEEEKIDQAAAQIVEILCDESKKQQMTTNNFNKAKKLYGYDTLEGCIQTLWNNI